MVPVLVDKFAATPEPRATIIRGNDSDIKDLPALIWKDGTVMTEWQPTEGERVALLAGENIRLWVMTGGKPLQPIILEVTDPRKA